MNLAPELIVFIEEAFPDILSEIPTDDYSCEDDVLFGVVLGIMFAKGWRQRLSAEEQTYVYGYIEGFLQRYP